MADEKSRKLSKKSIDALLTKGVADHVIWDSVLPNFGVRVRVSGTKTFLIQYRNAQGKQRRYTIGRYGPMTLDQARKEARLKLGEVALGQDPMAARQARRQGRTVGELAAIYFEEASQGRILHRGRSKAQSTLAIDRGRIARHIKPLLGNLPLANLSSQDVEKFLFDVRDGKTAGDIRTGARGLARVRGGLGTAGKCVDLLSAMCRFAVRRGWLEYNPCLGIERPVDRHRDRFLKADEYQKLGCVLAEADTLGVDPKVVDIARVLLLTGCRRGEILNLRKSEVDLAASCLRLKWTKTGAQMRPLGAPARKRLSMLMGQARGPYLFPASRGGGPRTSFAKPLKMLCAQADLKDVTAHVFRHSFATVAHELGYSELTIAGLLGHGAGSVTAHYAHHLDTTLIAAADHVSGTIAERSGDVCLLSDNVVTLRRSK